MVMITSQPTLILIVTMTSISICTSRMNFGDDRVNITGTFTPLVRIEETIVPD